MCIMIYSPVGKVIPFEHLEESYFNNPDGIGLMWNDGEKIHVHKHLTNIDKMYRKYQTVAGKYPIVWHFRIGTSGTMDNTNIHPFPVFDAMLAHNGVLDIKVPKYSKVNDTQLFIAMMERTLPKNFYDCKKTKYYLKEIGKTVGTSNKFVIMSKNMVHIVNEESGHWLDDIWYSNYSYLPYSYSYKTSSSISLKTGVYEDTCPNCLNVLSPYELQTGCCFECGHDMDEPVTYIPKCPKGKYKKVTP